MKAKLAVSMESTPLVRETKEMEAEVVRLRTMVRELKRERERERAKTDEQYSEQSKRHVQQVAAGQIRRTKQLEAEMVTQRAASKRITAELEALRASSKERERDSHKYQKESQALKRLLADAKTRQEQAVADATKSAEARIVALEGRNDRLMASLQAAAVTTRTAAGGTDQQQPADVPAVSNARRLSDESKKSKSAASRARRNSSSTSGTPSSQKASAAKSAAGAVAASSNRVVHVQPKAKHGRQPLARETSLSPQVEEARLAMK